MVHAGLATAADAIFDLDFHAVMHWGHDPVLEKHYVPTRSQRARSVLTFFAQDTGTHNLVYANADLSKAGQAREVTTFCDHWKAVSGNDPAMLIMDQKVTTHAVLGELDARGVTFLTLRSMRSPARQTHRRLDRQRLHHRHPRPAREVQPAESAPGHRNPLTNYPGTVRQLVVTGLGRDADRDHHQRPQPAGQGPDHPLRAADDHRATPRRDHPVLHADALSSAVNLNVDLDIMLCVLAQALIAAPSKPPARLRERHTRRAATPLPRNPGTITTSGDTITVHLDRRAYTPVLVKPTSPHDTRVPGGETALLRYES